ncbi:MAG: hypothetical protein MR868_08985 [Lachnospiraceae bacterium]|nr:hypothetical protein [Lachnospiraceae bacterium]
MVKTAEECLAFLGKARDALEELSISEDRETQLQADEKRLGKALEQERKTIADAIQQTVKKRKDEICASYDKEINKAQDQLKKAKSKREKAKNQGVKDRIADETADFYASTKELKAQMKSLFQKKHVPGFCRSALYYSLYFPKWPKEILTLLIFVLLCFLALPYGIYQAVPNHTTVHLIVIYVLDILIVGGIYVAIGNRTKMQHMETLRVGRRYLDDMRANAKAIRRVTSTIKKDRDEAQYNLEKFDDEIAQFQQDLNEVTAKKNEALNTFETVTKTILQDEIEHNYKEKLDQIENEYLQVSEQLKATAAEVKEKRLYITDHYGTYLGKEYLDPLKIAELYTIVQNGQASNVSEAITIHRNRKES